MGLQNYIWGRRDQMCDTSSFTYLQVPHREVYLDGISPSADGWDESWEDDDWQDMEAVRYVVNQCPMRRKPQCTYALFVYNRHKMLLDSTWEAIDQYEPVNMVSISCEMEE